MNQGAEKAAIEAKAVFVDAVRNMSVTDALGIVRGNSTAATDYFRVQTEASLRQRYLPIIDESGAGSLQAVADAEAVQSHGGAPDTDDGPRATSAGARPWAASPSTSRRGCRRDRRSEWC